MDTFENIRNFCIIAHIDHGKSTLADRLLEKTNTVLPKDMEEQLLDSNPIERERGITIKLAPVRMKYKNYTLNLIDTPGHVDFSYEVSRSLAACEGALLVVDATQGIQAQTLAHAYKALDHKLTLIPVVNKIDLPNADIEGTKKSLIDTFGFEDKDFVLVSAKTGANVDLLLEKIIEIIPPPKGDKKIKRALLFCSSYDAFKGVIIFVRIFDGEITKGDKLKLVAQKIPFEVLETGYFNPKMSPASKLSTGEVGYIATGLKDVAVFKVGDTITSILEEGAIPLSGYIDPKPFVFVGLYPVEGTDYPKLLDSLEKLRLNDSSLSYEPERSQALGHGFRVGFLGLLHAEITQERLEKEYNLNLIATTPSVEYKLVLKNGKTINIKSAENFPDPAEINEAYEPTTITTIIVPSIYLGSILEICQNKRGSLINLEYHNQQAVLTYKIPLAEIITDFYGEIKSKSKGYASMDYDLSDYQLANVIKLTILVNRDVVDALSLITVQERGEKVARFLVEKLKNLIPRQQFEIAIQASLNGKIVARSDISAFRKDVIQKLYGGDRTRKDKLLEAQKKGKKRLKTFGKVEIPQDAFYALFDTEK